MQSHLSHRASLTIVWLSNDLRDLHRGVQSDAPSERNRQWMSKASNSRTSNNAYPVIRMVLEARASLSVILNSRTGHCFRLTIGAVVPALQLHATGAASVSTSVDLVG